jgi:FKBP-type peptidyl-prolyl cis-trans isomerase
VTKRLAEGTGTAKPEDDDLVKVRYTVWKADGSLVQHVPAPRSATIAVPKMIPGWRMAVQQMVTGERRRAWVPPGLNGGKLDQGLVFDTELLEVIDYPHAPADVAAAPADATTTASGLAFKVLKPGTGTERPKARSTVSVHYSGWTTDGQLFDSSVLRGEPAEFSLDGVIKGWTEGLQLMVPGEKRRFWIPSKLAYGSDKTKPQGMLVFDVELLEIK